MTGSDDRTATDPNKVDAIKLSLMLADLRLPTINQLWKSFAKRADAEGWTAARFLAALAEHELAERDRRRIERHLREARLLPGKSLASFDFKAVPMLAKAQVMALAAGDGWLNQGANCLVFGPPGAGKSHLASAIGLALVENGYRVLFTRHHRSGAAPAGGKARARPRKPARKARPLPSSDPRRPRLRAKGSGRDQRPLRAHLGALRKALSSDHGEPALRRMEQGVPRRDHCGGRRRSPRPPRHNPRDERRELSPPLRARQTKEGAWGGPPRSPPRKTPPKTEPRTGAAPAALTLAPCGPSASQSAGRTLLHASRPQSPHSDIAPIGRRRPATICVCRAATINETKALAMPDAARNHAPAAGARKSYPD